MEVLARGDIKWTKIIQIHTWVPTRTKGPGFSSRGRMSDNGTPGRRLSSKELDRYPVFSLLSLWEGPNEGLKLQCLRSALSTRTELFTRMTSPTFRKQGCYPPSLYHSSGRFVSKRSVRLQLYGQAPPHHWTILALGRITGYITVSPTSLACCGISPHRRLRAATEIQHRC